MTAVLGRCEQPVPRPRAVVTGHDPAHRSAWELHVNGRFLVRELLTVLVGLRLREGAMAARRFHAERRRPGDQWTIEHARLLDDVELGDALVVDAERRGRYGGESLGDPHAAHAP